MRFPAFIIALLATGPALAGMEDQFDMTDANKAMAAIVYGLDELMPGDQVRWKNGARHGRATIGEYAGNCRKVKITATNEAGTDTDTYTMCQDGEGYWHDKDPEHQPSMGVRLHSYESNLGGCIVYNVIVAYPRTALSAGAVMRHQRVCHSPAGYYELQ